MKPKDLTGEVFGRLTAKVLAPARRDKAGVSIRMWDCECSCGKSVTTRSKNLISGNTKSCGCLEYDLIVARNKANATHNQAGTRDYSMYRNMIGRCHCPSDDAFKDYGGRGIVVCDRWRQDYRNFVADMGVKPTKDHTLDRVDNDGPYSKSNCRWATKREQCRNKRTTRTITYSGETLCIAEWAERLGCHRQTLRYRLEVGWSHDKTIETSIIPGGHQ